MTSVERLKNTLELKPVDYIATDVNPWAETIKRWRAEGHIKEDEDIKEHFDSDIRCGGWLNSIADLDHEDVVLEETEETILKLDGNGAKLRWFKDREATPEHVDFSVCDRAGWEEKLKPYLIEVDRRRIPFEEYRREKAFAAEKQRYFCWHGVGPFEQINSALGHEFFLMGMALDAEWVKDMVGVYSRLTINHLEVLFAEEGVPEGMFFYEDMGYKGKPFMSPQMYREIMFAGHKMLFDFAHSKDCKVIVHSCGYVEPFVPSLIEAGMNCLQAMEVKAGMDLLGLFEKFGDKIAFYGGIDARVLVSNDRTKIDEELLKKILPIINNGGGYILHTDHSEPPEVDYETMKYFLSKGRQLGTCKIG